MDLTKKERLLLANQFRILKLLNPNDAKYYDEARKILEEGYSLEYEHLMSGFFDGLTTDQCREVLDILDMHRALKRAYDDLPDKSGIDQTHLKFNGFDGNNETAQMGYARFLIHDQGRWNEFAHGDLNSHYPTMVRYRRMLREWKDSEEVHDLKKNDIVRIIGV
jgi:uncharacterized protein YfbU (UPF0304 family)